LCCGIWACLISQISYLLFLKVGEERVTQIGESSMLRLARAGATSRSFPAKLSMPLGEGPM
jgi:hypothetical protein